MQNKSEKFRGTGVAIVTPFTASGAIDFPAFGRIVENVIAGGVEYIVLLGTTGESATMSKQEKKALTDFAIETINGRVRLVLGIGGNNTSEVVLNIHNNIVKGVDAILSVCPYYNKPNQEGIYQHFKNIAEACPVPVILYTVPGRTASNIAAETTLRLASDFKNIIGIKEASANFDQIHKVIKYRPDDFLVISGDDGLTLPLLASGVDGVISVVANAFPAEFSKMIRDGLNGNFEEARKIHYLLYDLMVALFVDGSPAGIKEVLKAKNICENFIRLPLVPVNTGTQQLLIKLLNQIETK